MLLLKHWKNEILIHVLQDSLKLQNYDFKIIHRPNSRMTYLDALSRSFGILIINPFEWNLGVMQSKDSKIKELAPKLEKTKDPQYELRNGLVYKKK